MNKKMTANMPMKRKATTVMMMAVVPILFLVLVVTTFPQYGHWKLDRGCSPKVAATRAVPDGTAATYNKGRQTQVSLTHSLHSFQPTQNRFQSVTGSNDVLTYVSGGRILHRLLWRVTLLWRRVPSLGLVRRRRLLVTHLCS